MKHLKTWITENIRPELLRAKNAVGIVFVIMSFLFCFAALLTVEQSNALFIIAAAAYIAGMVLLFIPEAKKHDHRPDERNR